MERSKDFLQNLAKMSEEDKAPTSQLEANPDSELEPWEREVKGMYEAIKLVHQKAHRKVEEGFNGDDVKAIHKAVLEDPFNPHFAGELRKALVKMGGTVNNQYRKAVIVPVHPDELPALFDQFSQQLQARTVNLSAAAPAGEVIETATWAHQELIEKHFFIDGNGRTARLTIDMIFHRADLPYITDWGVKDQEYLDMVDRSFRESNHNIFKLFLARKLLKGFAPLEREGLQEEVAGRKTQVVEYLNSLKQQNAS